MPYDEITLRHSGAVLRAGEVVNPVAVVANYVFCVLEQDAFCVDADGTLQEGLVTMVRTASGQGGGADDDLALDDPSLIGRTRKTFAHAPLPEGVPRYGGDRAALDGILGEYAAAFGAGGEKTSFLVPLGAVETLEGIARLTKGGHRRVLSVASDKGYVEASEFAGRVGYPSSIEGSYSYMVNFDALTRYTRALGGDAVHQVRGCFLWRWSAGSGAAVPVSVPPLLCVVPVPLPALPCPPHSPPLPPPSPSRYRPKATRAWPRGPGSSARARRSAPCTSRRARGGTTSAGSGRWTFTSSCRP